MPEETPEPSPGPRTRGARPRTAKTEAPPGPKAAKPRASTGPKPKATPPTPSNLAAAETPATGLPGLGEATSTAPAEPIPLDVPLEEQITALPPLDYPGNPNEDFVHWAADKRRGRIRGEIIGGAFLVMVGVATSIFTGRVAFILIALFAIAGLAVYEFLVTSFE